MNGHAHALTSYLLAAPLGLATGLATADPAAGLLAAAGCVAGVLLSPDLDQDGITEAEAIVYRNGGQFLGHLWRTYWILYALIIPHRSWLSHTPGIGTAGRVVYLLCPFIVAAATRDRVGTLIAALWTLWPMGLGLLVSDIAHWAMDYL